MDCSRCNVSRILGVAGTCNVTTGVCICPQGYDGRDDWQSFNDCHIDENLRAFIRVMTLALSILCLLISLYAIVTIFTKEGRIESANRTLSKFQSFSPISLPPKGKLIATTTSMRTPVHEPADLSSVRQDSPKSERRGAREAGRQARINRPRADLPRVAQSRFVNLTIRRAYMLLGLFSTFGLSGSVYQIFFFLPTPILRSEGNPIQDCCVAVAASCMFVGLWSFTLMWYSSLPSIGIYGKLFDLNHILIKYPNMIRYACYLHVLVTVVLLQAFFFFLPLSIAGDDSIAEATKVDMRNNWDRLALAVIMVNIADWLFLMHVVCFLLRKVYLKSLIALRNQTDRTVYEAFFRGASNVEYSQGSDGVSAESAAVAAGVRRPYGLSEVSDKSASSVSSFLSKVKAPWRKLSSAETGLSTTNPNATGSTAARRAQGREDMLETFERASSVVRWILVFVWIGAVNAGVIILGMLTIDFMSSSKYMFFNFVAIVGSVGAIQLTYGLVFRALR